MEPQRIAGGNRSELRRRTYMERRAQDPFRARAKPLAKVRLPDGQGSTIPSLKR
jgi:hypothetical protein